jgi:hypothetical protein
VTATREPHRRTEPVGARIVPRVDTFTAARRHWVIVIGVTLLLTAAGVAPGVLRHPVYRAEARLAVGRIDVNNIAALGTYTTATTALASQYSRTIDAFGVTTRVARATGQSPSQVAANVSATPIAGSPVIKVTAVASAARQATRLANLSGHALITYTTDLNRSDPDVPRLLQGFRQASGDLVRARDRFAALRRKRDGSPTSVSAREIHKADVDLEVATLRAQTARKVYQTSLANQASTSLIQVLNPATGASDDRLRKIQLYGFVGFAAGLALGLALATVRANALMRRRFAG